MIKMNEYEKTKLLRTKIAGLKIGIRQLMIENFEDKEAYQILERQQNRLFEQEKLLDDANISKETYLPELNAILSINSSFNNTKN